ncbi:transcriptional repressor ctcf-like [Moniliophthora roreri]|nr:transcriptional repressor ctcf-like [Moniliophthora roreri]
MAPPKSQKPTTPEDLTCKLCGLELARKGDLPRHMRTHSDNKDAMLHRCPVEGCNFANLQRSNVDTHIRTHTKEKTHHCPDCDFSAVDPGSLTRHRRRKHNYIPKPRKSRATNTTTPPPESSSSTTATSRKSRRHQPYPHSRANSSPSPSASASASLSPRPSAASKSASPAPQPQSTTSTSMFPVFIPLATSPQELRPTFSKRLIPSDKDKDFFWLTELEDRIARSSTPKMTHPAVETTGQMQGHESDLVPHGYLTREQPKFTPAQEWSLGNGCGVWSDDRYQGLLQGNPHVQQQLDFAASEMVVPSWTKPMPMPMQPVNDNISGPLPTEEEWNQLIAQLSTEIPLQALFPSYDATYPSPQLVYPPSPDHESEASAPGSFSNGFTFTPSPRTEEYTLPSPTHYYYYSPQSTHDLPPF